MTHRKGDDDERGDKLLISSVKSRASLYRELLLIKVDYC